MRRTGASGHLPRGRASSRIGTSAAVAAEVSGLTGGVMEVETVGDVTLVTLPVRVDTTNAGGVEAEFKGMLEQGARKLVADFAGNEYVSSAGLRVFLSVLKALEKDGGKMVLCAMQPFVADVFEISGFSGLFTIVATRDEALAALA